jgi:hypothetical protein
MSRLLLIAAVIFLAPPLGATVLVPAEFHEIVQGSQVIVHGRVVDVSSDWTEDRFRIETIVTLEAGAYFKGGPGERVTFRVPGGTIGRYRALMVGAPEFRVGDEVVMFLRSEGPSVPQVFGLSQGVFRVRRELRSGRRVVVPPAPMATSDVPQQVRRGAASRRPVPLETFGAQVRTAMDAEGVRQERAPGIQRGIR